jgi:alpha-L-rhamnosidase
MQPPFLQAELLVGGSPVAFTGGAGFVARVLPERVQKVERFSKQRPFAEAYRLEPGCHDWRRGVGRPAVVPCETVAQPQLLPRGVRLPRFDCLSPKVIVATGPVHRKDPAPEPFRNSARDAVGTAIMGYPVPELEVDISNVLHSLTFVAEDTTRRSMENRGVVAVPAGGHGLFDFGAIRAGFIGARLSCDAPTTVYLVFDEHLEDLSGHLFMLGVGATALELAAGVHDFEGIEVYSLRYLRVVSLGAPVRVERLWLREYAHPSAGAAQFASSDPELKQIFEAARQTFRANAVDLFTDCPSRERGGYPCDSWFAARAERLLTGETRVERNFLENFLLVDRFRSIPAGMLPHCYPSDRLNSRFIPNWALWVVIQIADYFERSGDQSLVALARPRIEALFGYFKPFLNSDGLLENLAGWVFVEHSPANDCTAGVNHPTNMLYASALDAAARLYGCHDWRQQATAVRAAARRESWDGRWFADQSVRVEGRLQKTAMRSETCQYHALTFGVADAARDADLWRRLRDHWGPLRGAHMVWSHAANGWERRYGPGVTPRPDDTELIPANLFYGCMLRFELLARHGESARLLAEIRHVFGPQAKRDGTLWEHLDSHASSNHGFAAGVAEYLLVAIGGQRGVAGGRFGRVPVD